MPEYPDQLAGPSEDATQAFAHPAFAAARESGAPSVAFVGSDARIVWANSAAASLFEVAGYEALQQRLVGRGGASSRRIMGLLRASAPETSPRLERLRFAWGARIHNLTALCGRAPDVEGEPVIALAFLGSEADDVGRRTSWSEETTGHPLKQPVPVPEDPAPLPSPVSLAEPEAEPTPSAEQPSLETKRDALRAILGGTDICRFAWRTDATDALVQIDEPLMSRLGLPLAPDQERGFCEQIGDVDSAAAERMQDALADRTTWSGIDLMSPVAAGSACLPVSLGASPQFDANRQFLGFRGFGKIDLWRLTDRTVDASPPVVAAEPLFASLPIPTFQEELPVPEAFIAVPEALDAQLSDGPETKMEAEAEAEAPSPPQSEARPDSVPEEVPWTSVDRPANVVQLWPVHPAGTARPAYPAARLVSAEDSIGGGGPAADPGAGIVDGTQRSSIEAAVGRSQDRKGALTSIEHQAFQEIGRALGPGPRRGAPAVPEAAPPPAVAPVPEPMRPIDADLARHAAALVEQMTAGLLVLRQKRVLFANDALRQTLRFESHSELVDALALYCARKTLPGEASPNTTLALPSAYGEEVEFAASPSVIMWNGQPAVLWTLSTPEIAKAPVSAEAGDGEASALAAALDASGDAIALLDGEGRVQRLNRPAERLFGRDRTAAKGEDFVHLLAPESRTAAATVFGQFKADPGSEALACGECGARASDGSSTPLDMTISRLGPERFAVAWRDLSAQRGLERDLAHARRLAARAGDQQPDFLANVSHQIRTPLNAILGFTEIMMDERFGPLGNPRYKDYLKDMHLSGTQVISMIDDLMDLSQIETGRLDLRLGAVDINKVIVDCVADAHTLAHRERVIVRTSFGARLPPILADERSARQIIGNLLSNAIKFNEPGGQVIVSTAMNEASTIVVRIRDTGIGMSDKDIAAALEPFRQLAPTKNASGTGLGLPLTKALVGANGASLSMRSRPNEGTMVEVTFQATVAAPTRVPA